MTDITMFDTITPSAVPANPQAVAGYVGGRWPDYNFLVATFPNALHLSIAVNASEEADCLDDEPGDATNAQLVGWYNLMRSKGATRIYFYTSASNVQALINTLAVAGISRADYFIWSAHYTFVAHICAPNTCGYPQADATQWTDKSEGRNLDQSLCSPDFFHPVAPAPQNPHYDWFDTESREINGATINELAVVKEYDRLRDRRFSEIMKNRAPLSVLRAQMKELAGRLYTVAYDQRKDGHMDWGVYHRGWRYQQLQKRAQGERLLHG